jgi:hypothetical protein
VQTWNARTEGTNGIVMALESDVICQLLEKGHGPIKERPKEARTHGTHPRECIVHK